MIATSLKMLGIVRKVFGCLGRLWLCVIGVLCRGKRRHGTGAEGEQQQRSNGRETHEMNWDAEGWDEFSVTVVPNTATGTDQQNYEHPGVGDEQGSNENHSEEDLFQDMKPVFRKPQKIHIQNRSSEEQKVNLSKFAVQDSVFRQELAGELGAWSDDEEEGRGEGGWEEQGDLLTNSQHALRMKRASEREKRRKAQEAMRGQQRTSSGTSNLRLGTRVT